MSLHWRRSIGVTAGVFAISLCGMLGCHNGRQRLELDEESSDVCDRVAGSVAADTGAVSVVYCGRFFVGDTRHPFFTADQIAEIVTTACRRRAGDEEPWFVHGRANWKADEGYTAVATVYVWPTPLAGRLWQGECVDISVGAPTAVDRANEILMQRFGVDRDTVESATLRRLAGTIYWHVQPEDWPCERELAPPCCGRMPFPKPDGFSVEQVVSLIDFLRPYPQRLKSPGASILIEDRFNCSLPIQSIEWEDGKIVVRTGVTEGMLAGSGQVLTIVQHADGSFELLGIGQWVS